MKHIHSIKALLFPRNYTPGWVIFLLDLAIVMVSITLSQLIRYNFDLPHTDRLYHQLELIIPVVLGVRAATFLIFRSHAGIIRYTNAEDTQRIALVVLTGSMALGLVNIGTFTLMDRIFLIPFSVLTIDFLITTFAMSASRLIIKSLYHQLYHSPGKKPGVVIYGADEYGIITKQTLERDAGSRYRVIAFFDNDPSKSGKNLENLKINHLRHLSGFLQAYQPQKLILAKKNLHYQERKQVIETCLDYKTNILSIPDIHSWINGDLSFNQIKNIEIEDLMNRSPIVLDEARIKHQVRNAVILVTGAAGSIGSELTRQLIRFGPRKLILLDQAETPLYDLEISLQEDFQFTDYQIVVGDITDESRMKQIFSSHRPDIVYHAAAYKHVPMMETNPSQAVSTNITGTRILAEQAEAFRTRQFVLISTDKAVNPTNVMGASKRIAEIYIRNLNEYSRTCFVTTRFGNVLGSSGSVIPRFKKQIEQGGPLTITHPQMTRFFMTLSEACQLVLEAGSMARGGEIYLFDMGESIQITELARKMIRISGLEPDKDIAIRYTGLRPGEKIHEELLNDRERPLPTHHEKIMIVKEEHPSSNQVKQDIAELEQISYTTRLEDITAKMKQMVPEFQSTQIMQEKGIS